MPLLTLFQKKDAPVSTLGVKAEWNLFEEGQLLVDLIELPNAILVRALVAGIDPDHLEISLHNDMLTIRGSRDNQEELFDDQYLVRECYWGNFSRSVIIPVPVKTDAIQATFKNGVVTITLPKSGSNHSIPLTEELLKGDDDGESPYWEDEDEKEEA